VELTTHPHLLPSLKKEYSYTSTLPLDLNGLLLGEIYFTLILLAMVIDPLLQINNLKRRNQQELNILNNCRKYFNILILFQF